jgi:hypothetical protein
LLIQFICLDLTNARIPRAAVALYGDCGGYYQSPSDAQITGKA